MVRSSSLVRTWMKPPILFRSWGTPVSSASFCYFLFFVSDGSMWHICFFFAVSQCPHLKKRYQRCVEKVKEYLETVKDFDELVSPQSLFLHFLGPKPSSKFWRNLEVVKKSECSILSTFSFLLLLLLLLLSLSLSLSLSFIYLFFFYSFSLLSRMMTRFSKQKLVEV